MTSYETYYSNPFANDNDELCYAAVDFPDDADAGRASRGAQQHSQAAATSALQRRLEEANGINQQLHDEYEALIESLRHELAAANAKNNELISRVTRLESQVRAANMEKDTAEWNVQQAKDRNQALESRIAALEHDLAHTHGTAGSTAAHQSRQQPQPHQPMPMRREGTSTGYRSTDATPHAHPKPHEESPDFPLRLPSQEQQQQQRQQRSGGGSGSGPSTLVRGRMPLTRQEHQERQRAAAGNLHHDPNANGDADRRHAQDQQQQQQRAPGRTKSTASVQELDHMLLYHSRRRDELASELQRLDGSRLRSAVDRRRRENVEASLEQEERQIGHIRLLLRSQTSAAK